MKYCKYASFIFLSRGVLELLLLADALRKLFWLRVMLRVANRCGEALKTEVGIKNCVYLVWGVC